LDAPQIHEIAFDMTAGAALAKLRAAGAPEGVFSVDGSASSLTISRRIASPAFMGELKGNGKGSVLVGRFEYTREAKWVNPIGGVLIVLGGIYELAPLFTLTGATVVMAALGLLYIPIRRAWIESERDATLQWIRNVALSRGRFTE
jgi:hypothetical protein